MIFLDNASTTRPDKEVLLEIIEKSQYYANPSSNHRLGRQSKQLIENSRQTIAKYINCKPHEIIFVSSGTEANSLALQGFAFANQCKGNHIISSCIEHISVINNLRYLYKCGFDISYISVDECGVIDSYALEKSIRRDTILISIMTANNEIGTIQPIKEIGEIAKHFGITFHTDAIAAIGHCDIDVQKLNIDMMSISGHKVHSVKGSGFIYIKDNLSISPLHFGAGQNFGLNSGTENLSGIIGTGKAIELLAGGENKQNHINILKLKTRLIEGLKRTISDFKFNGDLINGLPNIVNVSFAGIDGKRLLELLDEKGICASQGSACLSNCLRPHYIVKALGVNEKLARGTIRFSLSKYNTENEIDFLLSVLPEIIKEMRGE